ncbi:MAG: DUF6179 domain-containing protein [Faecalibacterium sp.]
MNSTENKNGQMQSLSFSPAQQQKFLQKLWQLLQWQAAKYNGIDSTSLSAEKAQELLSSLAYTLSVVLREDRLTPECLLENDFRQLIQHGKSILNKRREDAFRAWNALCLTAPEIDNGYYKDTVQELGMFFKRYDVDYAADQIPCSIDYPLLAPVSEETKGVEYIQEYIRRLKTENDFIRCFDPAVLQAFLRDAVPDHREDYLNLCGPVLTHAVGRALLGRPPQILALSQADVSRLSGCFAGRSERELCILLDEAVDIVCRSVRFDAAQADYFGPEIRSLSLRASLAARAGALDNVFVPGKTK